MMDEAIGHRKMKKLCLRLNCRTYTAIGILEALWKLTKREARAGDIGRLTNEDIAIALDYEHDPDLLVGALTYAGWLDRSEEHRLIVHDWPEHCENLVHVKLARARELFADGTVPDPPIATLRSSERPAFLKWQEDMRALASGKTPSRPLEELNPSMDTSGQKWLPTPTPPPTPTPEPEREAVVKASGNPAPDKQPATPIAIAQPAIDDGFTEFRNIAEEAGMHASEPDWHEAQRFEWKKLDFEQKQAAAEGLRERAGTEDFALTSLPKNYLAKRMWQRPIRSPAATRPPAKAARRTAAQVNPDPALEWANGSPALCRECFDSGFLDPERKRPCKCTAVPTGGAQK